MQESRTGSSESESPGTESPKNGPLGNGPLGNDPLGKGPLGKGDGNEIASSDLEERVIEALKTCYDPEIPVDVYELGLIYKIDIAGDGACAIEMTLTSPACPVAGTLPPEVEQKVGSVAGIRSSKVEVVWDPPWTPERMSEAAKLELGMF